MEAKKSKKAAIENQRGSWLLMGLVVALAFMFVSFEWTQHDVRVATVFHGIYGWFSIRLMKSI